MLILTVRGWTKADKRCNYFFGPLKFSNKQEFVAPHHTSPPYCCSSPGVACTAPHSWSSVLSRTAPHGTARLHCMFCGSSVCTISNSFNIFSHISHLSTYIHILRFISIYFYIFQRISTYVIYFHVFPQFPLISAAHQPQSIHHKRLTARTQHAPQ